MQDFIAWRSEVKLSCSLTPTLAVGEPSFGIAAPFAVGLALLVSVQAAGQFTGGMNHAILQFLIELISKL